MASTIEPAPTFSRRVTNAAELQFALEEAIRATGIPADEIEFNGIVRLQSFREGAGAVTTETFTLSIMKRN